MDERATTPQTNDAIALPVIDITGAMSGDALSGVVEEAVLQAAPSWIPTRRWFGEKSKQIARVSIWDHTSQRIGDDIFAIVVSEVSFTDSTTSRYLIPLAVTREPAAPEHILAILNSDDARWLIVDGPEHDGYRWWLLDLLAAETTLSGERMRCTFRPTAALADYGAAARTGSSRVIRGEQSNTSIIYDGAIILKLFRKLQPGVNPDIEIGRFLTERTSFANAPALIGDFELQDKVDGSESIAVFQTFVPAIGDAWATTTGLLQMKVDDFQHNRQETETDTSDMASATLLGRRTGQMHVALASQSDDPAFTPELVDDIDIQRWSVATHSAAVAQRETLSRALPTLPPSVAERVAEIDLSDDAIADRIAGYAALGGLNRIRVHGDYHLGQVLRTLDNDYVILDFEGEPSRPVAERRIKTSPLKDVAGMLRSFGYACGSTKKHYHGSVPADTVDALLSDWEQQTRLAFIEGYLDEVSNSAVPLVPTDRPAFISALAAWELDKALYEVAYEANNRPDWLDIPLRSLAQ